jgi:alkylation response protein AidB-like acyl-CoA dehydrogenase
MNTKQVWKVLRVWHDGEDMGTNEIYFDDVLASWQLCDAFYDLDAIVGGAEHGRYVEDIFSMLNSGHMQGEVRSVMFIAVDCENEVQA